GVAAWSFLATAADPVSHRPSIASTSNAHRAMRWSTQSASVSVIQSRAQPSYARTKKGRKVLRRESPITIFAELADQLAEVRRHIWLYAKEASQTFPYLSANGLIMFCVNDAHVCTPMRVTARAVSTVWQLWS